MVMVACPIASSSVGMNGEAERSSKLAVGRKNLQALNRGKRTGGSRHGLESDEIFVLGSKNLGVGTVFEKGDGDVAAGAGERKGGVRSNQGEPIVKTFIAQQRIERAEGFLRATGDTALIELEFVDAR